MQNFLKMKRVKVVIESILLAIPIYLLYRFFSDDLFSRLDYLLLIILLVAGIIKLYLIKASKLK